jgi:hypothetical protein
MVLLAMYWQFPRWSGIYLRKQVNWLTFYEEAELSGLSRLMGLISSLCRPGENVRAATRDIFSGRVSITEAIRNPGYRCFFITRKLDFVSSLQTFLRPGNAVRDAKRSPHSRAVLNTACLM